MMSWKRKQVVLAIVAAGGRRGMPPEEIKIRARSSPYFEAYTKKKAAAEMVGRFLRTLEEEGLVVRIEGRFVLKERSR